MLSWAYESAVDVLVKMDCLETEQHSCAKKNCLKCSNSMPLWVSCTVRSVRTGWVWLVYTLVHILYTWLLRAEVELFWFGRLHIVCKESCIERFPSYRPLIIIIPAVPPQHHYRNIPPPHNSNTTTTPTVSPTATYHNTTRSSSSGIRVAIVAVGAAVGWAPAAASCGPGLVKIAYEHRLRMATEPRPRTST